MSLIEQLANPSVWHEYLEDRVASQHLDPMQVKDLSSFIENEEYLPVVGQIRARQNFHPPVRKTISKQYSSKKRIVYSFSREENYVLKLLTFLLIRKYDHCFARNLYSFRRHHGVRKAILFLRGDRHLSRRYVYKVDIRNYFNKVDVHRLLPMLERMLEEERETYFFLERLLLDPQVQLPDGTVVSESKGIMAGVPISSFLANVYLSQLDAHFLQEKIRYARYSDDIIVFGSDAAERQRAIAFIRSYLDGMSLAVNTDKEYMADPHERWDFLGVSFQDGVYDISPVSLRKLKKKMWRKSRALLRWKRRKQVKNVYAAKAFVKSFQIKLYDNPKHSELTWTRWYFPLINTAASLAVIDRYMQECIRYIATESRSKKRFCFSYQQMKDLGYRSLVHEYYRIKKGNGPQAFC